METILEGMSQIQFIRYCRLQEMEPEVYQGVPYPHPFLLLWLECRRQANPFSGATAYPEPEKGYMDQDAGLMLAFEVMEEIYDQREQAKKRGEEIRKITREHS